MNPPNLIASKLSRRGTPTRSSTTTRKLPCPLCNHSLSRTSCSLPTIVMFGTGRSFFSLVGTGYLGTKSWLIEGRSPLRCCRWCLRLGLMSLNWPRSWDTIMCSCVGGWRESTQTWRTWPALFSKEIEFTIQCIAIAQTNIAICFGRSGGGQGPLLLLSENISLKQSLECFLAQACLKISQELLTNVRVRKKIKIYFTQLPLSENKFFKKASARCMIHSIYAPF